MTVLQKTIFMNVTHFYLGYSTGRILTVILWLSQSREIKTESFVMPNVSALCIWPLSRVKLSTVFRFEAYCRYV